MPGNDGITTARFAAALVGFDIGEEPGRLAVIAGALALTGWFTRRPWHRRAMAHPAALSIAATGAYWMVERRLFRRPP